jgi:predicted aspartyl protease
MQLMSSGAFYVKASLDSRVNTDMLLDTGSGYVSLSDETFGKIKDEPGTVFQRYITGMMADGKASRVPVYLISELKLSEHCVLRDIEVAVLRNATRDILGLSALRQLQPLTLQLDPPVMTATCG